MVLTVIYLNYILTARSSMSALTWLSVRQLLSLNPCGSANTSEEALFTSGVGMTGIYTDTPKQLDISMLDCSN